MTQYDVAGLLQTYAEKAAKARDKEHSSYKKSDKKSFYENNCCYTNTASIDGD